MVFCIGKITKVDKMQLLQVKKSKIGWNRIYLLKNGDKLIKNTLKKA
jgi:hypothetical protein